MLILGCDSGDVCWKKKPSTVTFLILSPSLAYWYTTIKTKKKTTTTKQTDKRREKKKQQDGRGVLKTEPETKRRGLFHTGGVKNQSGNIYTSTQILVLKNIVTSKRGEFM